MFRLRVDHVYTVADRGGGQGACPPPKNVKNSHKKNAVVYRHFHESMAPGFVAGYNILQSIIIHDTEVLRNLIG